MNMEPKFHYTERMVLMKAPVLFQYSHKTGEQRDFSQLFGFISYKLYI